MSSAAKNTDDLNGAIDALERRAAHLSTLVYPEPGMRPQRSAHWRDEVELKGLRIAVKAIRERQARAMKTPDERAGALAVGLCDAVGLLERIVAEGRLSAQTLADARQLIERLDIVIDEA